MESKKIFICPLDWGLGHATRCIPLIDCLIELGQEVIIGAYGRSKTLLRLEYPNLQFIDFEGLKVAYSTKGNMVLAMAKQLPKFLAGIKQEHHDLNLLIEKYHFDGVISDNRFGCYNSKIPTVFISHQIALKTPIALLSKQINKLNKKHIERYQELWIPDNQKNSLAGELSYSNDISIPVKHLGNLSRFTADINTLKPPKEELSTAFQQIFLISGPEPSRTQFEEAIIKQAHNITGRSLIVSGKPEAYGSDGSNENISYSNHLSANDLNYVLLNGKPVVISRSGYSTIMDIAVTENKAILIPTPGQTEQEYLANKFHSAEQFIAQEQKDLDIKSGLIKINKFNNNLNELNSFDKNSYPSIVESWIERL